ncbi:ATP-binding cassette sub- G member 2 [Phlyctochytrium bullatum]|nr:ATP-binding cassette sub- G member 2 [Phlyctochytrium bullatum]
MTENSDITPAAAAPVLEDTSATSTLKPTSSADEVAIVDIPAAAPLVPGEGMTLAWENLCYSVPQGKKNPEKQILKGMDGYAEPGQILAILGGSGAGKSTLLNVLAGRIGPGTLTGSVTLNSRPRTRSTWRRKTAYVEQEEIFYKNLTVYETLSYAAKLRLPSALSEAEKKERVDALIAELGLGKARDTRIGDSDTRGVSGGEKKRVAIGVELITQPQLLFLDEPTSGLDSFTAVNIVSTISNVAKSRNATAIMTIHQPRTDILEMCDRLLILAAGRTVFFGRLDEALVFFAKMEYPLPEKTNPSDHFIDIATLDQRTPELLEASQARIDKFAEAWDAQKPKLPVVAAGASEDEGSFPLVRGARYQSAWGTQFSVLLGRNLREVMRDAGTLGATLGQGIILCIVMGFIFFRLDLSQAGIQNRLGALFFIVTNQTFGVVMPTLAVLPLERPIIKRERAAGTYAASAAYMAKFVATIPLTIVGALILGVPIYWMIGLQASADRYLTFLIIIVVQSFTAMALGLMIGSGVKSVRIGQIIGPLVIVLFLIFGGNFLNLDSVPIVFRWIQWVSLITYSNKALAQNEFRGLVFECNRPGNCLTDGEAILKTFALGEPASVWVCVGINLAMAGVFVALGYALFRRTSKPLLRLD